MKTVKNLLSPQQKKQFRMLKSSVYGLRSFLGERLALPNFFIAGTQRGGTSSLYFLLCQHPAVVPATIKEIHYFENPLRRKKGIHWYQSHFPTCLELEKIAERIGETAITGEATPFMYSIHAPKLVKEVAPEAKIIFLLRDPIARARSHFLKNKEKQSIEPLTFEEAILQEFDRISNDLEKHILDENHNDKLNRLYSYIHRGFYDEQLSNWLQHFAPEQILVLDSKDLFINTSKTLEDVSQFLGLSPFTFDTSIRLNTSNQKQVLSPDLEHYLSSVLEPHNKKLMEITKRSFSWMN